MSEPTEREQIEEREKNAALAEEQEQYGEGTVEFPNPYIYAGTPLAAPGPLTKEYWGFINKQMALANHKKGDEESIMNRLRIVDLTAKATKTRNELREFNKKNNTSYSNLTVYIQNLTGLGREALLIKEIGKSRKSISVTTEKEEVGMRESIKEKIGGFF